MNLFQDHQMPRALQSCQIDISHAAHFDIVQGKGPLDMRRAGSLSKIGFTQINGCLIDANSQIRSTARSGKLDKDIPHILYALFELFQRRLRASNGNRMLTLREAFYQFIHNSKAPFYLLKILSTRLHLLQSEPIL